MTRNFERTTNEEMNLVSENLNCSIYTMGAIATSLLSCIGIVIYALLG